MKKVWILLLLLGLTSACSAADKEREKKELATIDEKNICDFWKFRDSRHNICWILVLRGPLIVPCEILERCQQDE